MKGSDPICALLLSACTVPTAPGSQHVRIENRCGQSIWLERATREDWADDARALGRAPAVELRLAPGRYALRLGPDGPRVPLALPPPGELGFRAPQTTLLTVWPWPDRRPGWCWIPAGPALCGDRLGVGQEDERPLRRPDTAGFWLAARETTNAEFVAFLNALGAARVDPSWLDLDGAKCQVRWDPERRRYGTDRPDLPVVTVSWHGATAYCRWRTETTGVRHRLPHECEWEKAARGPGSRTYAYGDVCRAAAANQESGALRAGGRYPANGFGLFDMTANAFEWTADRYRRAGAEPTVELRALRGGSYVLDGIFVRNAMRMRLRPAVRADDVGFRVLRVNTDPRFGPTEEHP